MIKYKDFINESENAGFKVGDVVIYNGGIARFKGKLFTIKDFTKFREQGRGLFEISPVDKELANSLQLGYIVANESELTDAGEILNDRLKKIDNNNRVHRLRISKDVEISKPIKNQNFEEGDTVIFNTSLKGINNKLNGDKFEIITIPDSKTSMYYFLKPVNDETRKKMDSNIKVIYATADELTLYKKREVSSTKSKDDLKVNDYVIYNTQQRLHKDLNGCKLQIRNITHNKNYYLYPDDIETSKKMGMYLNIIASKSEIEPYEEKPVLIDTINIGDRVIINGESGNLVFKDRYATVDNIKGDSYFVELEEDASKNLGSFSLFVTKDMVKKAPSLKQKKLVIGDSVTCIDQSSQYRNRLGEITSVFTDGDYLVRMVNDDGTSISTDFKPEQLRKEKKATNDFTKKKEEISIPIKTGTTKIEREEEDEDEVGVTTEFIKKADLLNMDYLVYFDKDKLTNKEEVIANRKNYEEILSNKEFPEFKLYFYEKSLKTIDIIEQYFTFLEAKIAGGLPVYRTLEKIKEEDLLDTKTKVKASDSKEMTRKYSFDNGIIAYWKFKDAVIFKTI